MIIQDLDERGLHDEARRRLSIWLKYQGTEGLAGNFTDHNGVFFGAGGFEAAPAITSIMGGFSGVLPIIILKAATRPGSWPMPIA